MDIIAESAKLVKSSQRQHPEKSYLNPGTKKGK